MLDLLLRVIPLIGALYMFYLAFRSAREVNSIPRLLWLCLTVAAVVCGIIALVFHIGPLFDTSTPPGILK